MGELIIPLDLKDFEELPHHTKLCTFWEVVRSTLSPEDLLHAEWHRDSFEKEAWLSRVLLQWGICGQLIEVDEKLVGACLYAPPQYLPRGAQFPSGPVSPDAILLADVYLDDEHRTLGRYIRLVSAAIADIECRGVRAIEAYGRKGDVGALSGNVDCPEWQKHCCIPTEDILSATGFKLIMPDAHISRWRLDIDHTVMWEASVKAALDQRYVDKAWEFVQQLQYSSTTVQTSVED